MEHDHPEVKRHWAARIVTFRVTLITFAAGIVLIPVGLLSIVLSFTNGAFMFYSEPVKAYFGGVCILAGAGALLTSAVTGIILLFKHPAWLFWLAILAGLIILSLCAA